MKKTVDRESLVISAEFVAEWTGEQVSHHPPISLCYFKGSKEKPFTAQIQFSFSVSFHGTYLKLEAKGDQFIKFESLGEEYRWHFPSMMVYPIRWACEWAGKIELVNEKHGIVAAIEFCSKVLHNVTNLDIAGFLGEVERN
jgi:hypothetical protein